MGIIVSLSAIIMDLLGFLFWKEGPFETFKTFLRQHYGFSTEHGSIMKDSS